jgi:hydrogenase maturation protein HypF
MPANGARRCSTARSQPRSVEWALPAAREHGATVVLSGGCILNRTLTERLIDGFSPTWDHGALAAANLPANDGGLSLGQAWIALAAASR